MSVFFLVLLVVVVVFAFFFFDLSLCPLRNQIS